MEVNPQPSTLWDVFINDSEIDTGYPFPLSSIYSMKKIEFQ